MQQATAVPRTSGNVPWLLCPDLHSPRAFSISQWKSELLPSLGFFSKDCCLPVGAGSPGMGGMESALPGRWRPGMDGGISERDQEQKLDSLLEQLISWGDSAPPLCFSCHPQRDLTNKQLGARMIPHGFNHGPIGTPC